MTLHETPPRAGRREWIGLALLVLPTFVVAIDLFVLMLALPQLATALSADGTQQLWTMDIYGFVLAGFLITMGTLGDRIGRRKLLLAGSALFAVASLLCACSTSPEMLIAARALLGIAGAAIGPAVLGLITVLFKDPKQMAAAFGIWGSTFTLGALLGPVIGGAMLSAFWWGSVFLLGVPVMVLVLVAGRFVLPEYRSDDAGRLDPVSVVLSLVALLATVYGIKELAAGGWALVPVLAVVGGVVAGVLFVGRQRRLEQPLLDLSLFRIPSISAVLGTQLGNSLAGGGFMLLMMLYLQLVHGLDALAAGFAMVPTMLGGAIGFVVAPRVAQRFRPAVVIAGGLTVNAALYGVLVALVSSTSSMWWLIIGSGFISFFGAPIAGLGVTLAMGATPPEKVGSTGSLSQMANEFGGTLGIATLGTLAAGVYRLAFDGRVPAGVPADAAAVAGDSAAGAGAVAAGLPPQLAGELQSAAGAAFMSGLHVVGWVAAAIMLTGAAVIAVRLRDVPPIGREATPETADRPAEPAST